VKFGSLGRCVWPASRICPPCNQHQKNKEASAALQVTHGGWHPHQRPTNSVRLMSTTMALYSPTGSLQKCIKWTPVLPWPNFKSVRLMSRHGLPCGRRAL
jgi:hypothetical protein